MSTEAASPPNHKTNNDRSALKAGAARVIKWVGRLSLLVFFGGVLIVPAVIWLNTAVWYSDIWAINQFVDIDVSAWTWAGLAKLTRATLDLSVAWLCLPAGLMLLRLGERVAE